MARRWWLVVVVVATAGVVLLWSQRAAQEEVPGGPVAETPAPAAPDAAAGSDGRFAEAETDTALERPTARRAAPLPQLAGTVLAAGAPVDGAEVSWTALLPALDDLHFGWRGSDAERLAAATVHTATRAGDFRFERAPAGSAPGGVVWVTHAGYTAGHAEVGQGPTAVALQLAPAPAIPVRVEDGAGRPLAGATVTLRGLADEVSEASRDPASRAENRARRALARSFATDASGRVALPHVEGRVLVFATLDGRRSQPVVAPLRHELVLRIGPTFDAGGVVRITDGSQVDPAEVWVHCFHLDGFSGDLVAKAPVNADFTWSLEDVPWARCDGLLFRLMGGGLANRAVERAPPRPDEHVALDFEVGLGGLFRAKILDPEGDPIAGARAFVSAQTADGEWHGRWARAGRDGVATVPGAGPGAVWVAAEAPGYVAASDGAFQVDAGREYGAIVLQLHCAARIEGHCVFQGDPVEDFDLLFWVDKPTNHETRPFRGTDGAFVLDAVPPGPVYLRAQSPGLASSPTVRLETTVDEPAAVVLELRATTSARGRLVESATGDAVFPAEIVVLDRHERSNLSPIGPTVAVAPDGSFQLESLNPGENQLRITAPGFADRFTMAYGRPDEVAELGAIGLARARSLTVRVLSDTVTDFSGFAFQGDGESVIYPRKFPPDGVLSIPDLEPGKWSLWITLPDLSSEHRFPLLLPGRDWNVTFDLTGRRTLNVVVDPPADGAGIPEGTQIVTQYHQADGVMIRRAVRVPADGEVRWTDLPAQDLVVELLARPPGAASRELCSRLVSYDGSAEQTVHLTPDPGSQRVRVVDEAGDTLAGVYVVVGTADDSWNIGGRTDANGEFFTGDVDLEGLFAACEYAPVGRLLDVPVELSDAAEIVLSVDADLALRLVDSGTPCGGLTVMLKSPLVGYELGLHTSDDAGIIRVENVAGEVAVLLRDPACWPSRTIVASGKGPPVDVAVLRTGWLELEARASSGAPIAGATIALRSLALDETLADWIEAGLVPTPPAGVRTGPEGRLRIGPIPRGGYAWTVTRPDGLALSGSAEVPPGGVETVLALIAE